MDQKTSMKPLAFALGAAFATTLSSASVANAADNPFAMTEISGGYMVAAADEGKCGEGKCGGEKKATTEGKCGEGKCGMKSMDADGDGSVTKEEFMQGHEVMFSRMDANGDGVIDADEQSAGMKMMKEGKCGEGKCGSDKKSATEGKCGEGKCGGSK
ncbi:MAG: hypothetical protein ABFS45_22495 [Pseudomonadota bacterium]